MNYRDELFELELRKEILKIEFCKTEDEKQKNEIKALIEEINCLKIIIEKQLASDYKKAGIYFGL